MQTVDKIRHAKLLQLIDEAGSVKAVAERLGVSSAQISQLKTRSIHTLSGRARVMGDELARKIEEAFEKPVGWMDAAVFEHAGSGGAKAGGSAPAMFARRQPSFSLDSATSPNVVATSLGRQVPLISWVQAGNLNDVEDPFHTGDADDWVRATHSRPSSKAFALRVVGDSMTASSGLSFPEGTVLIVDPDSSPTPGKFVIAKDVRTQEATFKRLMSDGGRWFLRPLNSAYPTIEIDDPDLRVIGVVVEYTTGGKL